MWVWVCGGIEDLVILIWGIWRGREYVRVGK
jgi:hypothetical protein